MYKNPYTVQYKITFYTGSSSFKCIYVPFLHNQVALSLLVRLILIHIPGPTWDTSRLCQRLLQMGPLAFVMLVVTNVRIILAPRRAHASILNVPTLR